VKEDKVIGIILVVFSGLMYYKTLEFPPAMFGTLGAGVFPQILFTLLGLAGAALIITAFLRERKKGDGEKAGKERPAGTPVWNTFKESLHYHSHVIASFFLFFCYIVLMSYFGYTIATLIFMPILMWILGPRNRRAVTMTIAVSLGMTFVIYFAFLKFLKVFLPEGSLF
jgi:putative tricarboxylic transport membrane protein